MKAYIAGALFRDADRAVIEQVAELCEDVGIETFVPHVDAGIAGDDMSEDELAEIMKKDMNGLNTADFVIAILSGADVDSGTAWEMGYAVAQGKQVVGLIDDSRLATSMSPVLALSSELVDNLEELRETLENL